MADRKHYNYYRDYDSSLREVGPHTAEGYYRLTVVPCGGTIVAMIQSFADKVTVAVFLGLEVKRLPPAIQAAARRKLKLIDAAVSLMSLRIPPGNRLEALRGDRKGQWSIRINEQWRICFRWQGADAFDVEIVDYH